MMMELEGSTKFIIYLLFSLFLLNYEWISLDFVSVFHQAQHNLKATDNAILLNYLIFIAENGKWVEWQLRLVCLFIYLFISLVEHQRQNNSYNRTKYKQDKNRKNETRSTIRAYSKSIISRRIPLTLPPSTL